MFLTAQTVTLFFSKNIVRLFWQRTSKKVIRLKVTAQCESAVLSYLSVG